MLIHTLWYLLAYAFSQLDSELKLTCFVDFFVPLKIFQTNPLPPLAMCRPTSNSLVTGFPITALVTSAVTFVTVLFNLLSMDSMAAILGSYSCLETQGNRKALIICFHLFTDLIKFNHYLV